MAKLDDVWDESVELADLWQLVCHWLHVRVEEEGEVDQVAAVGLQVDLVPADQCGRVDLGHLDSADNLEKEF